MTLIKTQGFDGIEKKMFMDFDYFMKKGICIGDFGFCRFALEDMVVDLLIVELENV